MKESIIAFIIGCIIGGIAAYINYTSSSVEVNNPIIIERYIPIDTTENVISKVNNTKYIIDSLQQANDSLTGKLQVANYKLERIRYYNDVAKKGNNIKFLRGWINRVLDGND
jgi:hypothetical protein